MISVENLFSAWQEFSCGKRKKQDVQEFEFNLEDNLFALHRELKTKTYQHHKYTAFKVYDPKLREIHKAIVRDRVLHHAIFRSLYPVFDLTFIFDSYSCRIEKGTHCAILRLRQFANKASGNNCKNIFALKCDIKKFFDSVDQNILLEIIKKKISGTETLWLLEKIISSFEKENKKGLPLGNVTSQLFANIYMNELDQFMKHDMKLKYYLRYSDDFVIFSEDEKYLQKIISETGKFLAERLQLKLHERKIIIRKYRQGIDFLGYVALPTHFVLRTKTKRRVLRKISQKKNDLKNGLIDEKHFNASLQSYLGILKHCKGYGIQKEIGDLLK